MNSEDVKYRFGSEDKNDVRFNQKSVRRAKRYGKNFIEKQRKKEFKKDNRY